MRAVHSLSTKGTIVDPVGVLDRLILNMCISHRSQSLLFSDKVTSLPDMFQRFAGDRSSMVSGMKLEVTNYIRRTFDEASVMIELVELPNGFDQMIMRISALTGVEQIDTSYRVTADFDKGLIDLVNLTTSRQLFS